MSRPLALLFSFLLFTTTFLVKTAVARSISEYDNKNIINGKNGNMTDLQMHAAFFDLNNDGIIYPWEMTAGFLQLGYSVLVSTILSLVFSGTFSYATQPGWIPSLLFTVYIDNIHKCKHGSDTGNYDYDGRFHVENFEEIVKKFAGTKPDKLTFGELWKMTEAHRLLFDFFGWISAKVEIVLLHTVAKDADGYVSKEAFQLVYNGTLFYNISKRTKEINLKSV